MRRFAAGTMVVWDVDPLDYAGLVFHHGQFGTTVALPDT